MALPNAQNLAGDIQIFSIGLSWGPSGKSCGDLRLGKAVSPVTGNGPLGLTCGNQSGADFGIGVLAGVGWIAGSFETTCCPK